MGGSVLSKISQNNWIPCLDLSHDRRLDLVNQVSYCFIVFFLDFLCALFVRIETSAVA